jgi:hypothetical protein
MHYYRLMLSRGERLSMDKSFAVHLWKLSTNQSFAEDQFHYDLMPKKP